MDFVAGVRASGDRAPLFHQKRNPAKVRVFDDFLALLKNAFRAGGQNSKVPDWHYHQLRHAAANLWLLKLWPSLHRVARKVFRNQPETLAWIGETHSFRQAFYSSDKIGSSDLQAIAYLLGHGSSAVSLQHYLHCADWHRDD
jgi:integrase